jgi:serine phosphatase RsbU (regulator of sigma subunit)
VTTASRFPVLGIDPRAGAPSEPIPFTAGDTFVAYTDGLIERRGEVLDEGIAHLADLVREVGDKPVDEIADAILGRLAPDGSDDVALLIIRSLAD